MLVQLLRLLGLLGPGPHPDRSGAGEDASASARLEARAQQLHQARDHLVGLVGEGLLGGREVVGPGLRVPDLEPVAGTDDGAVLAQARVLAQGGRDRHPALLVGDLVGRAREEDAHVVAGGPAARRGLLHVGGDLREGLEREDVEAALLPTGDDEAGGQTVAELRGEEEAALVVETRRVGTEEHDPPPALLDPPGATVSRCPPLYSTQPPKDSQNRDGSVISRPQIRHFSGVVRSGADPAHRGPGAARRRLDRAALRDGSR